MSTPAPAPSSAPDMLTYEDAATLLGVSVGAIKRAVRLGKLHPRRFPGSNRKYLERADVLTYPSRRNTPASSMGASSMGASSMGASSMEQGATPPASHALDGLPDADKLRELASALSGPTIEALRDAQATSRAGIDGLVRIAFGLAIGATGGLANPKA